MTNKECLCAIGAILIGEVKLEDYDVEPLLDYVDKELAILERKAKDTQERNKSQKMKNNVLTVELYNIMDKEWKTIDDYVMMFNDTEVTFGKIRARLNQLAKDKKIEKKYILIDDSIRKVVYRRVK